MAKSLDLQVILAARDKITGPLKKINTTSTATARAIKQSQQEIRQLKASQKDISSFKKLSGALKDNARQLSDAQYRARKLGEELQNAKTPTAQMRKEYNKARDEVAKFTQKSREQRGQLVRVRKALKDSGIDTRNLTDAQQKLEKQMGAANTRIQRQQKYLAQLGKADISGKFGNMASEVGRFGRRALFATGGAAAGIFGLANSTATLGDQTAKTADKLGLNIAALQELRYAGERSGIADNTVDMALQRMVRRLSEAAQGSGEAAGAIEELGLDAEALGRMTPDAQLETIADRLASVRNQSDQVRLAFKFFDSEGVAMVNMLKNGSIGLRQLREDARATGYVLSDQAARDAETFKDALLDAQLGMAGMKNTIGAELMPAVTELMGDLSYWMRENRDRVKSFANEFGDRLKAAIPIIKNVAIGAASMASTLGAVTTRLAGLVGGFDNLGMILAFMFAMKPALAIAGFAKALFTATSAVVGLAGGLPAVAGGIKAISLALTANPIGIAIAAIAAAAYLIYKNWDGISDFFRNRWNDVKQAFNGGLSGIGKLILNWSPMGLFYKAFRGVLSWFGIDLPAKFTGFGGMLIDGLTGGITAGLTKIKDTVTGAGKKAIGWFKDTLGIKSPSRVFMAAGRDTLEGYRQGLQKQEPQALKQVTSFGKRMRNAGAGIAMGAAALPAAADLRIDTRAPIAGPAAPARAAGGDTITINVHPTPEQSAQDIAAEVHRILQQRDRAKARRAGSALYDTE